VRAPTAGFADIRAGVKDRSALTRATKYWPTGHKVITSLVTRLTAGKKTDLERLKSLHGWVFKSIRYSGRRVGSRDGTLNVLKRRFGRCWDKSDVLVTLARAAGLPSRQVAGWAEELGTGHIWSEVFVKGRGWVSVDATAPWIGVGGGYVPLMTTDDGEMSVLYVEMPKLERLK
jgi:transglutaminase-like putative cysteine protease